MADQTAYAKTKDTSWSVRMAQYVPPPSAHALASALPFFKKRRGSLPGTWLSSKSTATVTLSSASCNSLGPSIALILQGHVHEEHLLSTLAFTWPRFRDENGDTSSPGRVILASYKKICTDEKHKFAMQFETVLQAECFFETLKQLIAAHSGLLEDSCRINEEQLDYDIAVPGIQNFNNNISGVKTTDVNHGANTKSSEQAMRTRTLTLATDVLPLSELSVNARVLGEEGYSTVFNKKSLPLVLPPRFPSLDLQHRPLKPHTNGCQQQKGEKPSNIAEDSHSEPYLKEMVKACFLDPEFLGFVERVERIWHAMEDDLTTEISSIKS